MYSISLPNITPLVICEQNPYDVFETDVTGSLNIFDAYHKTPSVKNLFCASTVYVHAPSRYLCREIDKVLPVYVYGGIKLIGERAARRYRSSVGIGNDILTGRLFNVSDTRETNPHFLPEVVRQILAGANT